MAHHFAYLDLGAGSMLVQMILAGVLGISLTIKTYWRRIIRFVRHDKAGEIPTTGETPLPKDSP